MKLFGCECDVKSLSPLTLAFVGDSVYDLMVREMLVSDANRPAGELHSMAVKMVNAGAQDEAYKKIADLLTEEETNVYKRGRNAHTNRVLSKNISTAQYHSATGIEALFGYLYLTENADRLRELFKKITG